jgi:hypothetical protein
VVAASVLDREKPDFTQFVRLNLHRNKNATSLAAVELFDHTRGAPGVGFEGAKLSSRQAVRAAKMRGHYSQEGSVAADQRS